MKIIRLKFVFFINWDESGLGYCCSGWNCCYPCPYMSEETFPSNFRWSMIEERGIQGIRRKIVAIKEPGPGCVGLMWCLPPCPNFFLIPCFLWQTKAINMTFYKRKNDHVDCDYREKGCCFEDKWMFTGN